MRVVVLRSNQPLAGSCQSSLRPSASISASITPRVRVRVRARARVRVRVRVRVRIRASLLRAVELTVGLHEG